MSKLSTSPDAGPVLWDGEDYQCEWPLPHPISPPKNYTVYHVVNGIMLGATDTNNARFDYLVDVLGSVTGQTDSTGASVGTYRWKPYGSSLSTTGVASGKFGWTGNTGSRAIGLSFTEQYNRNRYFSTTTKQWTTRDTLWPREKAYGYVGGMVVSAIDPSGRQVYPSDPCKRLFRPPGEIACTPVWNEYVYKYCNCCGANPTVACLQVCDSTARTYYDTCVSVGKKKPRLPGNDPFLPPPGGGEVAPRHPDPFEPEKPASPCFSKAPPPLPEPYTCYVAADGHVRWKSPSTPPIYLRGEIKNECDDFCQSIFSENATLRERCYDVCWAAYFNTGWDVINTLDGIKTGGSGSGRVTYDPSRGYVVQ